MPSRPLLPAGLLLVSALTLAVPSGAASEALPGTWTEVRSAHFVVLGNAKRDAVIRVASDFERIRELFRATLEGSSGVTAESRQSIFVARDERTLLRLMPYLEKTQGPRIVVGRNSSNPALSFAMVRADYGPEATATFVHRGYFQSVASRSGRRLPVWLYEGLADLWSNVRFEDDATEFGRPLAPQLSVLRGRGLIPLEQLFQVDGNSSEFHQRKLAPMFAAESWAVVHYLALGDSSGARKAQLDQYLRKVRDGADALAAARECFGDLRQLETEVYSYIQRGELRLQRLSPVPPPAPGSLTVREVSSGEAAASVALAQLQRDPIELAAPLVDYALAQAPSLAAARAAAGLLALRENRLDDAARWFEQATTALEPGPLPFYGLAAARLALDPAPEELAAIERLLLRAIELDPGFAPAHSRLSDLYLRRKGEEQRALESVRKARTLFPHDEHLKLREAQALLRSGDAAAAQTLVSALRTEVLARDSVVDSNRYCWHASLSGFAAEALPLCDRAVEASASHFGTLDSRAVARALAGDFEGARNDLGAALALGKAQNEAAFVSSRTPWLEALERDENPLTPEVIRRLSGPEESDYWGY